MHLVNWLRHRDVRPEHMDDFSMGGHPLSEALVHLRWLNRIFGAAAPTRFGVECLWKQMGQPAKFSILDIGAGSGDVNRALLRWARKKGIDLNIILVDITSEACTQAKQFFQDEPRVQVIQGDLFELPSGFADIVTASQFVHHFSDEELPYVAACMLRASKLGIVINDIHRHWLAWTAVWIVTHLISKNAYIRHDGSLSVAKGFRSSEWQRLKQVPGLESLSFFWRPLFRYAVIVPKKRGTEYQ